LIAVACMVASSRTEHAPMRAGSRSLRRWKRWTNTLGRGSWRVLQTPRCQVIWTLIVSCRQKS